MDDKKFEILWDELRLISYSNLVLIRIKTGEIEIDELDFLKSLGRICDSNSKYWAMIKGRTLSEND